MGQIKNKYTGKIILEFDANLRDANLRDANLCGANLCGANLCGAIIAFQIVPESGSFIAWKKTSGRIIKLQIPAKAKRTSNLRNRKCRAEFVETLQIQEINGKKSILKSVSGDHGNETMYKIGEITRADSYDDDIRIDCTHGIHFFITRKEAVDY